MAEHGDEQRVPTVEVVGDRASGAGGRTGETAHRCRFNPLLGDEREARLQKLGPALLVIDDLRHGLTHIDRYFKGQNITFVFFTGQPR